MINASIVGVSTRSSGSRTTTGVAVSRPVLADGIDPFLVGIL
jgi:hypothetical protein